MWVEVKALDPPATQQLLDFGWTELRRRLTKFEGKCRVYAWIAPSFTTRTAKQVIHVLSRAVNSAFSPTCVLYVSVPDGEVAEDTVQMEWIGSGGTPVRMIALRSKVAVYNCPPAAEPEDWSSNVRITESTASLRPAFEVLSLKSAAPVTLRVTPDETGSVLASIGHAEAREVNTIERLRRVVNDANDQFKNALTYRELPGLLFIYFDYLGGGDYSDLMRACFGDLSVSIDQNTLKVVDTFYGSNGALRPNRNTAVSAIMYRSRHYPTVSLINPWARYPVSPSWLPGTVCQVDQ